MSADFYKYHLIFCTNLANYGTFAVTLPLQSVFHVTVLHVCIIHLWHSIERDQFEKGGLA